MTTKAIAAVRDGRCHCRSPLLRGPVEAQGAQPVKNIVLVHGAFADGSSWAKVIPILQAEGLQRHGGAESADVIRR